MNFTSNPTLLRAQLRDAWWVDVWTRYAARAAQRSADLLVLAVEMAPVGKPPAPRFMHRALRHAMHSHAAIARAKQAAERIQERSRAAGLRP
jgi:hypothetical protein